MYARLSQAAKHLSGPRPGTAPWALGFARRGAMASADERNLRTIHTAACLIIGDEVLNGKVRTIFMLGHTSNLALTATHIKIVDTNSAYVAKWCFQLGIDLKRIEVIEDDESEIMEAVRRMSDRYDFVVTRHDDITYQSIAKAFGLPLVLHQGAYERMKRLARPHPSQPDFNWNVESPAKTAKLRMVEVPTDETRDMDKQFLFLQEDLWVPVCVVNGNIHILPGVPKLFTRLIDGLKSVIMPRLVDPEAKGICRIMISTPMAESAVAPYLTELAARVEPRGVKVGSYPRWEKKRNTVTLVGKDKDFIETLVPEVVENVKGKVVTVEGEDDDPDDKDEPFSQ
ncbi:hypothetical protein RB598_006721 [Gaeumannomyces tritici]